MTCSRRATRRVAGYAPTVEGFRLDRGFQVLLTAYPEAQAVAGLRRLTIEKVRTGRAGMARRQIPSLRRSLPQPHRQRPGSSLTRLCRWQTSCNVAKLRARVRRGTWEEMFARPEKTTRDYLQAVPFSPTMIERFFEPFFGGVFLERELVTSSRFFEFLFRMFSVGDTAVPARGMQQIPLQLAAKLPAGTLDDRCAGDQE